MAGGKLISTGVEFPDATTQTTSGLPLTGGALTGAVTTTSTFDGRDVAADGVTADAALPKAGGTMTGTIAGFTSTGIDDNATSTAITIDASENVGINNTNPAHALDVTGDIEVSGRIALGSGAGQVATVNAYSRGVASGVYSAIRIIDSTTASSYFDVGLTGTDLKFYHNSVYPPKMTLSSAGQLTIKDNLVIGTSGKGIDFSADGNAGGMTSEVLDDYETGTWTPAWTAGASDATYVTQVGTYTKIGNKVHVQGRITISSIGTMSGALLMTGLPFTSSAATNNYSGLQVSQGSGLAITAGTSIGGYYPPSSTNIYVQLWDVTAGANGLTAAELSASGNIIFSVEYVTA